MRTLFFPRLRTAAIILMVGMSTLCGAAATASKQANPPTAVQAGTQAKPAAVQKPIPGGRRVVGPFDRVIAPYLPKVSSPSATTVPMKARQFDAGPATGTGSGVNFPGFVSVPFATINNGDSNATFDSVSADFNNDGNIDIATIQVDGTINVILNPGNLSGIASQTPLPPNTSASAGYVDIAWVVAADLNSDGFPDLVAQDAGNNAILIWLGKGDGTFGSVTSYPVAPTSGATWSFGGGLVVADFNGDGIPDVATVTVAPNAFFTSTKTVITEQTFINKGDGTLTPGTESDATFNDFYSADYGELDVVSKDGKTASGIALLFFDAGNVTSGNMGNDIIVISSNGDGTFAPAVEPVAPLVQDSQVYVSGGVIGTNLTAKFGSSSNRQPVPQPLLGSGTPTTDIVFITGDGAIYDAPYTSGNPTLANLLVGQNTELPSVLNMRSSSRARGFDSAPAPSLASSYIPNQEVLSVADMNGDGLQDLLMYANGSVYIFPNSGGAFTAAPSQLAGATGGDQQPQPADFDGSGFNSFVNVDFDLGQIGYYENLGGVNASQAGQFYAAPMVVGSNAARNYTAFGGNVNVQAATDVNGDGLQDVIAYDWSLQDIVGGVYYPDIAVGINTGAGTGANQLSGFNITTAVTAATLSTLPGGFSFVEPVTVKTALGTGILVATSHGLDIVTTQNGSTFSAPTPLNLGTTIACPPNYADVADVNGDGVQDILVAYGGDGACGGGGTGTTVSGYFVLLGNADGSFQTATFTPYGLSLYQVRGISFNSKGTLDLAVVDLPLSNSGLAVYILPGNGDGTFNTSKAKEPVTNYIISDVVPGDFNSDGRQDLTLTTEGQWNPARGNIVPNTAGVLLLPATGDYIFGAATVANAGNYPLWGSYADFNGDGAPDLALAEIYNVNTQSFYLPLVQVLPNLGSGTFGPAIAELDSYFELYGLQGNTYSGYTFTGNFGNSGGADLVVTGSFNTAMFINQGVVNLALTSSAASADQGAPVTLTAKLSQSVSASSALSGPVSFYANGTLLGAASVSGGTASLTTTELPVGSDTVTATYAGDAQHNQATASVTVTVATATPAFTASLTPSSLSLVQGATGSVTLNLTANGTFTGAISFACSGVPTAASCTVNPTSLTLGANQTGNVAVIIATTPKNDQYQASNALRMKAAGGISVACLLLFLVPRRRLQGIAALVFALLALGSLTALSGCGGGGNKYPGTPVGTSTVTVTATSGSITQTQTIALTITAASN